ncbi:MAG: GntR family transcriptional regulator, partial [Verrucomicrobiaceae bacterium]
NSIYSQLREELRVSVLQAGKPGDRVPSERQLAQQFGVSPITISRALQELQHEGCIERIPSKGTFIARSTEPLVQENLIQEAATPVIASRSMERQNMPHGISVPYAAVTPLISRRHAATLGFRFASSS